MLLVLLLGVDYTMKIIFVDYRISDEERKSLSKFDYEILIVPPSSNLYKAVSGHPDMLLHIADKDTIVVHKDMDIEFIEKLKKHNINVLLSNKSLKSSYPLDISLNALNLNSIFIHNVRYTDSNLIALMQNKKIKSVKQGYTKCSTAVVNDNAVMTSDKGIAKVLIEEGIDVLFLHPGDILLPGLNYGFIGGCCGLIDKNIIAFYGDLRNYSYGREVTEFLKKYKVEPVFLSSGKLVDRGSILVV